MTDTTEDTTTETEAAPNPEDFVDFVPLEEQDREYDAAEQEPAEEPEDKPEGEKDEKDEKPKTLEEEREKFEEEKADALAKLNKYRRALENKDRRGKQKALEARRAHEQFQRETQIFRENLHRLSSSTDPTEIVTALGQLMGKPGTEAVELITTGMLKGKGSSSEIAELKAELAQLRKDREEERVQAQQRELATARQRFANAIISGAGNTESYPLLSEYVKENSKEVAQVAISFADTYYRENGQPVAMPEVLARLESELARKLGPYRPVREPEKQPASGLKPASQALDAQVDISGSRSTREMTEEERRREAMQFIHFPDDDD